MKTSIAKSEWIAAVQCPAKAWRLLRAGALAPSEAELFRMQQGQEIGALARSLYSDGVFVSATEDKTASGVTQDLISDTSINTLFEATFSAGPFIAKADILKREGAQWHVIEVKSSFSDTSRIGELIDDLAYTVMVLKLAGFQVAKSSLALLSRAYHYGESPHVLFDFVEQTDPVNTRVVEFQSSSDSLCQALLGNTLPAPALASFCRSCQFFDDDCLGAGIAHTVLELPGLHHTKLKQLSVAGIIDLTQLPKDLTLNDRQQRAKLGAFSSKTLVDSGLGKALESVEWPCHYLDFETVATVLPLYIGQGCYQQVLTQFSIHHRDNLAGPVSHSEYLADATKDCERELAEALIDKLGQHGSIMVYSSFEKTRLTSLRNAFADLADALDLIIARLVDLHPLVADYLYHPDFKGSFSIKKVLPALVPDLSYSGLDVADGDTAITRFARMVRGEVPPSDIALTRQKLLDYCKVDTLAMVRLHEALFELGASI
jgi:CRISPR/Cas system-associated exonuclease Cas4 (RecB family)